jgi:hypothetical protein
MKRTNNTPPGPVAEAKEALFRNLLKQRLPMTPDMLTREEIERLRQWSARTLRRRRQSGPHGSGGGPKST